MEWSSQKQRRMIHECPAENTKKGDCHPGGPQVHPEGHPQAALRVAPYCRVSTGSEEQETSFTAQMDYFTQRIAANPDWTMAKMYEDRGISGTSAKKRPEFLKMIRDAEKGKIDLVVTKSVSRFCRNTLDGLEYVRRLKRCGVGMYLEKENTNTLYMDNEMILTFMMSQAQAESESLSTNVKWGFRKRFADGVVYYHTPRWTYLWQRLRRRWSCTVRLADWSAAGQRRARLWPLPNIYVTYTLTFPASLPGTCGECGISTVPMQIPQK